MIFSASAEAKYWQPVTRVHFVQTLITDFHQFLRALQNTYIFLGSNCYHYYPPPLKVVKEKIAKCQGFNVRWLFSLRWLRGLVYNVESINKFSPWSRFKCRLIGDKMDSSWRYSLNCVQKKEHDQRIYVER